MKNMRLYLCLIVAALLLVLAGCKSDVADAKIEFYSNEENKTGYVLENEYLKLEMDGATGYFTLTDKIGGAKWDSVPAGAEDDPRADTDSRNKMRSTLIISYTDRTGNVFTYDNYTYGISGGSFRITEEDETLILDYMLGPEKRNFVVPEALTETKMQEWLDKMEQGDKTIVLRTYRKLDLSKIKDPERQKELLEYLPQLETDVMYALSQATGGQPVKNYQMEQLETIFTNLGYTKEQAEEDKVNKEETEDSIQVNISMHFRLDGDCLAVDVPQDKLVYNAEYPVTQIRPLPYLCAAGDEDDGYMLIPDGGGGQIFFHNGKTKANAYFADVYGFNEVFDRKMRIQETSASFPVFGIAKNGNYLLAIGESGAAEMSVEADIAGKNSSFDHVCPVFTAVHGEATSISQKTESTIFVVQSQQPKENLSVRYYCGASDSYVDMATRYRTYLEEHYPQFTKLSESGIPLVIECVGIIDRGEKLFGIPVRRNYAAADYSEVLAIVQDLSAVENLRIRYSAVLNGGMDQKELSGAKVESKLGSKEQRQQLLQAIEQANAKLYINAYAEQVMNRSWMLSTTNTVRNTMNTVVERYPFYQNTQEISKSADDRIYLLDLEGILSSMDVLAKEAKNWNNAGIGFSDIGSLLYSDFSSKENVSRDEMLIAQAQLLAQLKEAGEDVLVDKGFAYAAVSADCICNLDIQGSGYNIVDRQIPFYQIALHGYVSYTGEPLNTAGNYRREVLKSIETGAGLYYSFFEVDYQELQKNRYTYQYDMYGGNFADWEDELQALYSRVNEELSHTVSLKIVEHSYLTDTVTCTRYEDGTEVYVNYGAQDWSYNKLDIPAYDWITVKGGK